MSRAGLGLVVALLVLLAAPARAHAFVGENFVKAAGGGLTKAAEKVITGGPKLPEIIVEAGAAGGDEGAGAAAGVFEGAGVLPVLGAVLSFYAGTQVGSEICQVVGIEGCWYYGSTADPDPAVYEWEGSWQFREQPCTEGGYSTQRPFAWYAVQGGGCSFAFYELGGNHESCGRAAPGGGYDTFFALKGGYLCGAGPEAMQYSYARGSLIKYAMTDRTLAYHSADDPAIDNYEYEAPNDWQEQLVGGLQASPAGEAVGQEIAHDIAPEEVPSPYALTADVPDCDGLVYATCAEHLAERGLTPERVTRTWETADPEGEPDEVLELDPKRATEVEKGTAVKVITNPDEAGMPVVIPQPQEHETYADYAARLNPALQPERVTVPEANEDVAAGPDAVLGTTPEAGTRADPAGQTDVEVRANPHTAPQVGATPGIGGAACDATVPGVDLAPLNQPIGGKFPFGIFAFFVGWVGGWEAGNGAPNWDVTVLPQGVFGSGGIAIHVDLGFLSPLVAIVRVVFLFASFVGLLWFLGTAAAKLQGDGS